MKKQIEATELKDIANKFALFNLDMPMHMTVLIGKSLIKTVDKYVEDGKVTFDFVDLKTLYESDYYHDYDGSLYKGKKAPFVSALLENLIKDPKLMLQQYYAEKVVEYVMKEANSKAKIIINPNELREVKFDVYSTELIVTNHLDLPFEFSQVFGEILKGFDGTINTIEGCANFTEHVTSKYNFAFFITGQKPIYAFQKSGEIMFGEIDYENFNEDEVKAKYKDKPFISDENSLLLIDRCQMEDFIAEKLGKPQARKIVDEYLKQSPGKLFKVPSDMYSVKFTPDIEQLKTVVKQEEYSEVNPLFILRSESLENNLKQNSSSKPKRI